MATSLSFLQQAKQGAVKTTKPTVTSTKLTSAKLPTPQTSSTKSSMTGTKNTSANKTPLTSTMKGTATQVAPGTSFKAAVAPAAKTTQSGKATWETPPVATKTTPATTTTSGAEMTRAKMISLGLDPATGLPPAGKVESKAEPVKGVTPTKPLGTDKIYSNITNTISQYELMTEKFTNEIKTLEANDLLSAEEYYQTLQDIANARNEANQRYLDELKAAADDALSQKNLAIEQGAEQQRRDAEIAYDYAKTQEELQRQRTMQAYNEQLVEQKAANLRRTLNEESRVAALGGFGNSIRQKEMVQIAVDNDKLINSLVFNKDTADAAITAEVVRLSETYKNDLQKIELAKQTAIMSNYNQYLSLVQSIQNDREMSEKDKAEALANAAYNYKQQVSSITSKSFTDRYNMSVEMADKAREVAAEQEARAKTLLKESLDLFVTSDVDLTSGDLKKLNQLAYQAGYPLNLSLDKIQELKDQAKADNLEVKTEMDNAGNLTVYSVDTTTGKVVSVETLEGIGKITPNHASWNVVSDGYGGFLAYDQKSGTWTKIGGGTSSIYGPGTGDYDPYAVSPDAEQIVNAAFNYIDNGDWKQDFQTVDVLKGGTLGCAWVVTGILEQAGVLDKNIASIANTIPALEAKGWTKTDTPKPGDVVVWEATSWTAGHKHIGIVTGDNKAVNNQGKTGPAETSISGRPVEGYWTPPKAQGLNIGESGIQASAEALRLGQQYGLPPDVAEALAKTMGTKTIEQGLEKELNQPQGVKTFLNPMGYSMSQAYSASDAEMKNMRFAQQAAMADKQITAYKSAGLDQSKYKTAITKIMPDGGSLVDVAAWEVQRNLIGKREQDLMSAQLTWIENVLRPVSGAAIKVDEYQSYATMYFPVAGASEAEKENAAARRAGALYANCLLAGKAAPFIENFVGVYEPWVAEDEPSLFDQNTGKLTKEAQKGFDAAIKVIEAGGAALEKALSQQQRSYSTVDKSDEADIDSLFK